MAERILFTIGHSTRPRDDFVQILRAWQIQELIDVRTVPRSRTFPWFSRDQMESNLPVHHIDYLYLPALGGFRTPKPDSANTGWENLRFRAYADYMQTDLFVEGLAELNRHRRQHRVCIMCSEAVWWRCHRRMIADAEVARGIPVRHIMSATLATPHELTKFAVVKRQGRKVSITYPGHFASDPRRRAE